MSKIILHIGTHKTATTTIQDTFFANRKLLEERGIHYPDIRPSNGHHALVADWVINLGKSYWAPEGAKKAWADLRATYAKSDKTVFLSSEEFSRLGVGPNRINPKALRAEMAGFDEVQVVCVLRDQVGFMQSIYLELSKNHQPPPVPRFLQVAHRDHLATGCWLDYTKLYGYLLEGFAPEEIHFVNFRNAVQHQHGILGHFWDMLGLDGSAEALIPTQWGKSNVSPDPLASWAANTVAAPNVAPKTLVELTYRTLEREFGTGVRTCLFARAEVEALRKRFTPMNEELAKTLRKIQPDFVVPEITSLPEDAVHRGRILGQYWAKVAQDLYRRE